MRREQMKKWSFVQSTKPLYKRIKEKREIVFKVDNFNKISSEEDD